MNDLLRLELSNNLFSIIAALLRTTHNIKQLWSNRLSSRLCGEATGHANWLMVNYGKSFILYFHHRRTKRLADKDDSMLGAPLPEFCSLQAGLRWELLPEEMGCGSGMTCRRRARDWQQAAVWDKLHRVLLAKLCNADHIGFSRVIADSGSVQHVHGKKVSACLTDARGAANSLPRSSDNTIVTHKCQDDWSAQPGAV